MTQGITRTRPFISASSPADQLTLTVAGTTDGSAMLMARFDGFTHIAMVGSANTAAQSATTLYGALTGSSVASNYSFSVSSTEVGVTSSLGRPIYYDYARCTDTTQTLTPSDNKVLDSRILEDAVGIAEGVPSGSLDGYSITPNQTLDDRSVRTTIVANLFNYTNSSLPGMFKIWQKNDTGWSVYDPDADGGEHTITDAGTTPTSSTRLSVAVTTQGVSALAVECLGKDGTTALTSSGSMDVYGTVNH